ncbi:MAG: hypothetical protein EPN21_10865 [Methylococcaceae bacterium]|nr:MAG: hypothetical protein EPN21_10865 [Methylococcaceae bacterium]
MMKRRLYLVTLIPLLGAQALFAQEDAKLIELSLEELMHVTVNTASKENEAIGNAAAVINTISREEISRFGANTLAEVLERSTSLLMTGSHMYGQNVASLRGDLATHIDNHVLFLLNGRPVREGMFGGLNYSLYSAFPLAMIDKIEVIRGPGSVLYGSNAYSGVINIITRKSGEAGTTTRIAAKGGTYNSQGVEASHFWNSGDLKLNGGMQFFHTDGWHFQGVDERGVDNSAPWGNGNLALFANGQYRELNVDFLWTSTEQTHWGALPVWVGNQATQMDKLFFNVGWDHRFTDHWRLNVNGTYNTFNNHLLLPTSVDGAPPQWLPNSQLSRDGLFEATHFFEYGSWKLLFGSSVNVMSGTELTRYGSRIANTEIADFIQPWYSLYTQVDYQVSDALKLTAGGQAIKTRQEAWGAVPRAGVIYHFNRESGVKVLYGEAFRAPFQFENNIDVPGVLIGNASIRPETVGTLDLQAFYHGAHHQLALTYFNSLQSELIGRIPTPDGITNTFTNKGELSIQGVELEGKLAWDDWFLTSSATYQSNRTDGGVDNYTTIPNVMAKLGLSYKITSQFTAGVFNSFFTHYHDVQNHFPNASFTTQYVNPPPKSFDLMTLKLDFDLGAYIGGNRPLKTTLYAYNLLDEKIYQPEFNRGRINSIPAKQGRSFYFGFEYAF